MLKCLFTVYVLSRECMLHGFPYFYGCEHYVQLLDRFESVAELLNVCWLEIRGEISTHMLSSKTHYAVYLVFKLWDERRLGRRLGRQLGRRPTEVSVG